MTFFARRSNEASTLGRPENEAPYNGTERGTLTPRNIKRATRKRGHALPAGWSRLSREVALQVWNKRASSCPRRDR